MKNHVSLIGRAGTDAVCKTLEKGQKVSNLSLATTEKWTNEQGAKVERTDWHSLVIWGKSAELAERFIKKGNLIAVEGALQYREYTDKEGQKRHIAEIKVDKFYLLTPKSNDE